MLEKYIKIQERVLKMKEINANDKLLYGLLIALAHKSGEIYAKNDFLGDALGVSQEIVKRSLKRLKDTKLIEIANSNRYRVIKIVRPELKTVEVVPDKKIDDIIMRLYNRN